MKRVKILKGWWKSWKDNVKTEKILKFLKRWWIFWKTFKILTSLWKFLKDWKDCKNTEKIRMSMNILKKTLKIWRLLATGVSDSLSLWVTQSILEMLASIKILTDPTVTDYNANEDHFIKIYRNIRQLWQKKY